MRALEGLRQVVQRTGLTRSYNGPNDAPWVAAPSVRGALRMAAVDVCGGGFIHASVNRNAGRRRRNRAGRARCRGGVVVRGWLGALADQSCWPDAGDDRDRGGGGSRRAVALLVRPAEQRLSLRQASAVDLHRDNCVRVASVSPPVEAGSGYVVNTTFPMTAPLSSVRCASAARSSGKMLWTRGLTVPAARSGHTCASRSRPMAPFSSTLRGRSVEPVSVARRCISAVRLISALLPPWRPICTRRPSFARHSMLR